MRKVKILTVPNPVLRKKSKEISRFDAGLLNLIREMKEVLKNQKDPMGLGLSAVQIGVLKRVFLAKIGIVTAPFLRKHRKYAILAAFVIAAILTPTPDVVNQFFMAGPLILLYEVSIFAVKVFASRPFTAFADEKGDALKGD